MNIIGAFLLVVIIGFTTTVFNRTFLVDNNWKDGEPCLIDTLMEYLPLTIVMVIQKSSRTDFTKSSNLTI